MTSLSTKLSNQMKASCNENNAKASILRMNKASIDFKQFAVSPKKIDKLNHAKPDTNDEPNTLTLNVTSGEISVSPDEMMNEERVKTPKLFIDDSQQPNDHVPGGNTENKDSAKEKDDEERNTDQEKNHKPDTDDIAENDNDNPPEQNTSEKLNQSNSSDTEKEVDERKRGKRRQKQQSKDSGGKKKRDEKEPEDVEDALPTFKNSVGKTFDLDLTEEVKEYVKELDKKFNDADVKNPTVADVKYIGAKALAVLLRFNDRAVPKGATKEELAKLVHDYIQNGCPPRCPKCKRGSLRFSNGKKKSGKRYYWCPGSATSNNSFYGCNFKADRKDIQRVPWKSPD